MSSDPRIGTRLGEYRIESLLGRGGMSAVYLAEHDRLKRKIALKVLSAELAEDPVFRARFVSEWERLASLDHPNIIPIYEAGEADGQLYIAMRYVDTTDLKGIIRSEGALEPARGIAIVAQVASALDAAHTHSLVHRDVKPANVLIALGAGFEGIDHAYLSDFGLTKRTDSVSGLTKTGSFMGTIDYVAPEQIAGKDVDGRADQYALGCVLFECLTGRVPFPREEETAAMFAHLQEPPPRATDVDPDLPAAIDEVIARAMAKEREDRYPTCMDFARAARIALALVPTTPTGVPRVDETAPATTASPTLPPAPTKAADAPEVSSGPPAPSEAPRPEERRGRSRFPLLAGSAIVVVIVVVIALTQFGSADGDDQGSSGSASGAARETGPSGTVLVEDSFDDPSTGWETTPTHQVQRALTPEGTYRLEWGEAALPDAFATSFRGAGAASDTTDVRVAVSATLVGGGSDTTQFGVVCRTVHDGYYSMAIYPNGFWDISRIFDVDEYRSIKQGTDPDLANGEATYKIDGRCTGGQDGAPVTLALMVNGLPVATAVDKEDTIASGAVGIIATGGPGQVVEFDDFLVEDLTR